jgi:hypothetical protein
VELRPVVASDHSHSLSTMYFLKALVTASWAASILALTANHLQDLEERGLLGGLLDLSSSILQTVEQDLEKVLSGLDPFTNKAIDVTGDHEFRAPLSTDQRGPCPGLNAMANHGYIARSGVVSLIDAVAGVHQVYNMGIDLALVLAIMGVVWTGDPVSLDPSFSIGGNSTAVWNALDNVQGLLGTPQGIDYSHNFLEADASPTRNDLYLTDDAWTMNTTRFQQLYDTVPSGESFSFDVLSKWSAVRWHESVETNPYFYYGPFTGMIARNAGYFFMGRLFANHSQRNTEGILSKSTRSLCQFRSMLTTKPQLMKPCAPFMASISLMMALWNIVKATSRSPKTGTTHLSITASCS